MTRLDYTVLLAQRAAQSFRLVFEASPELHAAAKYLGAEATRDVLMRAARMEAEQSWRDYLQATPGAAQTWIAAGAVDRMFGAVVAVARARKAKEAQC